MNGTLGRWACCGTRGLWWSAALLALGIFGGCSSSAEPKVDENPTYTGQEPPKLEPVSLAMVRIPRGSFTMGSEDGQEDERPVHVVELSAFDMGAREVDQGLFQAVMGFNPSTMRGDDRPVETVTWTQAAEFCAALSLRNGGLYRLPTEAEWEYAARGGLSDRRYAWGDSLPPVIDGVPQANLPDESYASLYPAEAAAQGYLAGYDDGFARTSPVGSFSPNGYGLYDMVGNVAEWVSDYYVLGTQYYAVSPRLNPKGPASGSDRSIRGASWWAAPDRHFMVSARFRDVPSRAVPVLGFRCVREVAGG